MKTLNRNLTLTLNQVGRGVPTAPPPSPRWGLEVVGNRRKEFAGGEGPPRTERAGASESLDRGEVSSDRSADGSSALDCGNPMPLSIPPLSGPGLRVEPSQRCARRRLRFSPCLPEQSHKREHVSHRDECRPKVVHKPRIAPHPSSVNPISFASIRVHSRVRNLFSVNSVFFC